MEEKSEMCVLERRLHIRMLKCKYQQKTNAIINVLVFQSCHLLKTCVFGCPLPIGIFAYINQTINQSVNQFIKRTAVQQHKNEYQRNNIKHSDKLPEKQIAHLSRSPN